MYKLTVSKTVPNPNYEDEVKNFERNNYRNSPEMGPQKFLIETSLLVDLTDEQFNAVRVEVLKAF